MLVNNVVKFSCKSEALSEFVKEVSNNLKIPFCEFENGFEILEAETFIQSKNRIKLFSEKKFAEYYKYEGESFKITFNELSENSVELFWIEVWDKNNGIGTNLLNKILDAADELNLEIRVIPIPFNKMPFDWNAKRRLKEWYESFNFKSKSTLTPALYYSPNK